MTLVDALYLFQVEVVIGLSKMVGAFCLLFLVSFRFLNAYSRRLKFNVALILLGVTAYSIIVDDFFIDAVSRDLQEAVVVIETPTNSNIRGRFFSASGDQFYTKDPALGNFEVGRPYTVTYFPRTKLVVDASERPRTITID